MTKQKIANILRELKIPCWTEGKNVSVDSVNVRCPFCDDHSNHCGIFTNTVRFHCWRCHTTGSFGYLLSRLTTFSEDECERIVRDFDTTFGESTVDQIRNIFDREEEAKEQTKIAEIDLPRYFEKITPDIDFPLLYRYLERRRVSLETIIGAKCGICRVGKYMNRMIIPVFFEEKVVAFQAADLTGTAEIKYQTSNAKINSFLYNYDNIERRAIIVEGILDAWRVGKEAVASFGTHLTERQKQLILDKELDELVMCWDGAAYWYSREVIKFFEPFISVVKVIKIPDGEDPDSFGRDRIFKFINQETV